MMSNLGEQSASGLSRVDSSAVRAERAKETQKAPTAKEEEVASDLCGLDAYLTISALIRLGARERGIEFSPSYHAHRRAEALKTPREEAVGNPRLTRLLDDLDEALQGEAEASMEVVRGLHERPYRQSEAFRRRFPTFEST